MQLTGPEILRQMRLNNPHNADSENPNGKPNIIIRPFDEKFLGSNSYDLHLAPKMRVYKNTIPYGMVPAIVYKDGRKYSMEDWFSWKYRDIYDDRNDTYAKYLKGDPEYDFRNPKFLIDPSKANETIEFEIPETGAILNPQFGYLASTVEYTETHNLFPYIDGKSSLGRNFILNHHTAGRGDDGFCGTWTLEIRVLFPTVVYPGMRIGQIYYEEFKGNRKPYNKNRASHYNGQSGPTPAAPVPIDLCIKDLVVNER